MTIDEYIERQTDLFRRICRTLENLRKLGEAKTTLGQVQSRLDALNSNWLKFQDMHETVDQIRIAAKGDQLDAIKRLSYFAKDYYGQCEEQYLNAKGELLDLLGTLKTLSAPIVPTAVAPQLTTGGASKRLPRIELPTFSGNYSDWKSFHDLFTSIVRENSQLSEVEKLHYLKTSLTDEPSQLIKNIALTAENFPRAWETLVSRYENKRLLTDSHLATLFAIPRVTKKSSSELKSLHSNTCEALGALELLDSPEKLGDHIIVHMTIRKLDPASLEEWEKSVSEKLEPPTFAELKAFLIGRIHTLEAVEQAHAHNQIATSKPHSSQGRSNLQTTRSHTAQSKEQSCACCKGNHYIAFCSTFRDKSLDQRREVVSAKKLCFDCLGPHQQKDCRSNKTCRVCNGRHHSLLHRNSSSISTAANSGTSQGQAAVAQPAVQNAPISNSASQVSNHSVQPTMIKRSPVLLATVQLIASNPETGERIIARALLDQGSESSFVTESLAQQLRLRRHQATIPIIGVGAHQSAVTRGIATLQLQSRAHTSFSCQVEALVLPRLTSYLPSFRLLVEDWPHLRGLNLADPSFAHPSQIDVILGADIYSNIIGQGVRRGAPGTPIAQETQFGWVLSGCVSAEAASPSYSAVQGFQCSLDHELLNLVQQFWKQEEVSKPLALTSEEERCEQHFRETVSRTASGRYVVRLPLKDNSVELGNSRNPAHQMLLRLEKRFGSDAKLKEAYSSFLREYRELGHMRRAINTPEDNSRVFYLPHHGVVRDSSSTTKLRVVFNGSQRTNLGLSLNDNLLVGPKVQTDLADVLLRWRQYPVAFSSDIVKMYRQIFVHNDDQDFQRILWREEPELPIEEYQLTTVTYGLASAPYLAIRVLHQLVQDEGKQYPFASHVILENTYVDDILSGAEDVDQGREKINELNQLLKAGGFELQKWTSSHPENLVDISRDHQEIAMHLNLDQSPFFRALGLAWRPDIDAFAFSPQIHQTRDNFTKRKVLSQTAQLFDPLGWLSPITIRAKIFMQELWALGFDWDEPLSASLSSRWIEFLQDLQGISAITIPRWIGSSSASLGIEIHGFADASQTALGAVIYARTYINTHEVRVSLVCAKTKVAPLKKVTIPRLELCATNLLVRLMCHVEKTLNFENTPVYLWTDSTVALAWIKSHPSRWKEFVRNRVTEIQEFARARWYHISGFENPADLASRGTSPEQLQKSELWTFGPSWLSKPSVNWPSLSPRPEENIHLEERKGLSTHIATAKPLQIWDLVDRYSKLSTLLKVTSLCKRAANRFLAKTTSNRVNTSITVGPISTLELSDAQLFWTKVTQQAYFAEEIRQIETSSSLTRSHPLSRLTPFIDSNGFLRVGGRLNHSLLSYDEKHPFILPRESSFSTLIIDHHHRLTLHGGPQLTLATIRQRYWILGGRVPIRMFIHRCVPCVRHRATLSSQQMGQLPQSRVTQSRPFLHSGVDYAGPFSIQASRGRGAKSCKGYIVIFICFTTSAVHLELVSDYTTEAFIAAYKRFTSRRGICASIASDCGTNLVGADSELRRLLAASSKEFSEIANTLASHGTQWRFNPPSAPHFGGKWEAGVKSVKFHLKRVIGEATQTFEQFATFLTQVEATLNSRPLCAISDDPRDPSALTPGHFLVGSALNTIPEPSLIEVPVQRLSHWQHSRQMLEHFWKRWSTEYLQSFQNLSKWQTHHGNIKIGSIVLVKNENLPPSVWPLARVIEVHPGTDGLVRVVTVKTKSSVLKRPIVKLCVLPVSS
ncbi:uncharacterized protein [Neodiprion pinetum]|uniref:uncharacterized protein n=1 Tax=Neodiprion pinetum TaxID=441929 RepID=UPI001EDF1134|nr:uncharacterized protein LOC124217244 [Neodiprion pinetum]